MSEEQAFNAGVMARVRCFGASANPFDRYDTTLDELRLAWNAGRRTGLAVVAA